MNPDSWHAAFLLTQAIEIPIYLWAARSLPGRRRAMVAVGASAITHPIIWFCLPWETAPYLVLLVVAECFAVTVEAQWGRLWQVPRPWSVSLVANAASLGIGSLVRWAFDHS